METTIMRYIITTTLFFLSFIYSLSVFSQDSPEPNCTSKVDLSQGCYNSINCSSYGSDWSSLYIVSCGSLAYPNAVKGVCVNFNTCSCPDGWKSNTVMNTASGQKETSCIPDIGSEPEPEPPETCPSGFPKVDGQCPVCPTGHQADGSCNPPPDECPSGSTKQGTVNGVAVCQPQCDGGGSFGYVNGVAGCYPETPQCPNGGSFGYVNGVGGCYGGDGSGGDGNGSGSGGGDGSGGDGNGSGSGGGGGDGSGGDGNGSGSGGGDGSGGDGNGSGGGGGGGGSPYGDMGYPYPEEVSCPSGFVKEGQNCISKNQDCPANYHAVIVSSDPFVFLCFPDENSSSSQSSEQSSQPSSQASSAPSSARSSSGSSSGNGSSSGSGSSTGGEGNGGDGSGSGECDPESSNYFECAGLIERNDNAVTDALDAFDNAVTQAANSNQNAITKDITDFKGVPFSSSPTALNSALRALLPASSPCVPISISYKGFSEEIDCDLINNFKQIFGWFLAICVAISIYSMAIKPVDR